MPYSQSSIRLNRVNKNFDYELDGDSGMVSVYRAGDYDDNYDESVEFDEQSREEDIERNEDSHYYYD